MIAYIKAKIALDDDPEVPILITEGGVGYAVNTAGKIDFDKTHGVCAVWQAYSQDRPTLYGFASLRDRALAIAIASTVAGIGPTVAARIVQTLGGPEAAAAIMNGNGDAISATKGVSKRRGAAIAEAMSGHVVLKQFQEVGISSAVSQREVSVALAALGFSPSSEELSQLKGATANAQVSEYIAMKRGDDDASSG